jgi:general stress protein 26
MRFSEEQLQALPKIYEKIKGIKIAMLTTADRSSGMLHSRPMATHETESDGTLWFFTYANSEKADEVQQQSKVNVSYSDPVKDVYVSVSGEAEIVEDKERMKEMWTPFLKAWFPDGLDTQNIGLLKVKITEAEYWDAHENRMVKMLKYAKSILKGQPGNAGEHEKVDLTKSY